MRYYWHDNCIYKDEFNTFLRKNRMSNYKTYEYIWLDGYQPEPSMRSKVKATDDNRPPDWSFDGS